MNNTDPNRSPGIDVGDNNAATDGTTPGDLDGLDRIVDGQDANAVCDEVVDMGAYEATGGEDCP